MEATRDDRSKSAKLIGRTVVEERGGAPLVAKIIRPIPISRSCRVGQVYKIKLP